MIRDAIINENKEQEKIASKKKKFSHNEQDNDPDYKNVKSSTSCYLDDIIGIIFGGLSSRFWMLRKHFISLSAEEI